MSETGIVTAPGDPQVYDPVVPEESPAYGQVFLAGVQFDVDPEEYTLIGGRRRGSVHRIIDGSTIYQDRGFQVSDMVISLTGKIVRNERLRALFALYRRTGYPMTYKDWENNEFTVVFTPGEEAFQVSKIQGTGKGWEYTMSLSVLSCQSWFNGGFPSQ